MIINTYKKFFTSLTLFAGGLYITPAFASDSFTSQFSHVASGAVLAGYISHRYAESENRAWIGFGISTALIVVEQSYEISKNGNRSGNQLDMVSHAIGSAIGAWYTDKYLLVPVVKRNSLGLTIYIPID
jgi:hypothetical protein